MARVRFDFGLSTSEQGGGFLQASAPASNDLAADVETWYSRQCREKPTQALRGRNLGRDIPVDSEPMVRAVSTNVAPPRLLFGLPLDAGVDASKNPPFWTDATKIREEPVLFEQSFSGLNVQGETLTSEVRLGYHGGLSKFPPISYFPPTHSE